MTEYWRGSVAPLTRESFDAAMTAAAARPLEAPVPLPHHPRCSVFRKPSLIVIGEVPRKCNCGVGWPS